MFAGDEFSQNHVVAVIIINDLDFLNLLQKMTSE